MAVSTVFLLNIVSSTRESMPLQRSRKLVSFILISYTPPSMAGGSMGWRFDGHPFSAWGQLLCMGAPAPAAEPPHNPRPARGGPCSHLLDRKELPKILNMNINFFANLFRLSRLLGKNGHSFLVTTRRRSRDFLVTTVTESFYLAMYFTFLVFIVGLAASLKWRYKDQLVSGFVRNNLPAVGNPLNQITWETFEHIGSKELTPQQRGPLSLLVDSPFVERIDVYNDSLIIKPRTPWEKLKGQRYIGFYTPSPSSHAQSAHNTLSSTIELSHLALGDEASRPLGPSSILTSSARLHVPARGFVEFSPLTDILPPVDHALQGQVSQVFGVPSDGFGVSMQGPSSNFPAPGSKFEDPAGLTEFFNAGSFPITTRPTSMVTISDQETNSKPLARFKRGLRFRSSQSRCILLVTNKEMVLPILWPAR